MRPYTFGCLLHVIQPNTLAAHLDYRYSHLQVRSSTREGKDNLNERSCRHPRFEGIDLSSTSPSFDGLRVPEISCDPLSVQDAKRIVPTSGVFPLPKLVIVMRDHGTAGSAAAFFKESMRRDAMTGTKTVFTLRIPSLYRSFRGCFEVREKSKLTPRA